MSHLGERVAALVDGELDHDSRDRAVAHLTRCEECRSAVREQRWLKSRMRELAATEPSAALRSSLFEIGRSWPAETSTGRPPSVTPRRSQACRCHPQLPRPTRVNSGHPGRIPGRVPTRTRPTGARPTGGAEPDW